MSMYYTAVVLCMAFSSLVPARCFESISVGKARVIDLY